MSTTTVLLSVGRETKTIIKDFTFSSMYYYREIYCLIFAECPPVHYIQQHSRRPSGLHNATNHRTVNATLDTSPWAFVSVSHQTESELESSQITVCLVSGMLKLPILIETELITPLKVMDKSLLECSAVFCKPNY